jgi:3-hydroxyacyl-CoA dehydrogenase
MKTCSSKIRYFQKSALLDEGIVRCVGAIDIIFTAGYGFPANRGGRMWFADEVGLSSVYPRICEFERRYGCHWSPAPLFKQLAEQGESFADYDKQLK